MGIKLFEEMAEGNCWLGLMDNWRETERGTLGYIPTKQPIQLLAQTTIGVAPSNHRLPHHVSEKHGNLNMVHHTHFHSSATSSCATFLYGSLMEITSHTVPYHKYRQGHVEASLKIKHPAPFVGPSEDTRIRAAGKNKQQAAETGAGGLKPPTLGSDCFQTKG